MKKIDNEELMNWLEDFKVNIDKQIEIKKWHIDLTKKQIRKFSDPVLQKKLTKVLKEYEKELADLMQKVSA